MPDNDDLKEVTIYTDGAAVPNPGKGGYGVVLRFGKHVKELSGGFELTTNNRMELMAVCVALETLKERCRVKLYSDSKYIVDAVASGSASRWRQNGWGINATGTKQAKNPDLWERLLRALEVHAVEIAWVKGHAGVNDNERCDQLAMTACQEPNLPSDDGYKPETPTLVGKGKAQSTGTKTKMTAVGQPCRKCQTPVIKRVPKKTKVKPNQAYYFAWYLHCPACKAKYMVEEAKRAVTDLESAMGCREAGPAE